MSLSVAPLLIHSTDLSLDVRETLQAAYAEEQPAARTDLLATAARLLHRETELDCADVRELVGLPGGSCS